MCGDCTQRNVRFVDDPTGVINPVTGKVNQVLAYWLKEAPMYEPMCSANARNSASVKSNFWKMAQIVRLYIHPDMLILKNFTSGTIHWNMYQEIWATTKRGGDYGAGQNFRVSFQILKDIGGEFFWSLQGNQCCTPELGYWAAVNSEVEVPFGEWFTMTTKIKAGTNITGENEGRIIVTIKRDGYPKTVLFDVINWTTHPEEPNVNPIESWSALKQYVGPNFVDYVRVKGGILQLFWDDWEFYLNWTEQNSVIYNAANSVSLSLVCMFVCFYFSLL